MIIPKEESASFQRWQASSFDRKPAPQKTTTVNPAPAAVTPAPEESPPPFVLPTVDEIEHMHEEARRSGYEAGLAEGKAAAAAEAEKAAETNAQLFGALINNLQAALAETEQSIAEEMLALSIEIAAQITRGSIAANTELLLPIIREAIASLPLHHAHLTLRLNPRDAERIRTQLAEQFTQTSTQIIEDREISPGGCLLQAGTSEVDATIETRWKRVLEAIGTEPQAWLNH